MRFLTRKKYTTSVPDTKDNSHKLLRLVRMPSAIYAIGDIHGCFDLYDRLETKIIEDGRNLPGTKLILSLGDFIDRGGASAKMIDRFLEPAPEGFKRLALRGNHEDMMIKFMSDPGANRDWLNYGGIDTLASYGLSLNPETLFEQPSKDLQRMMMAAIPDNHRRFLDHLPLALSAGPYRFAHASYDRSRDFDDQQSETLLWGDPAQSDIGEKNHILVHGHIIVERPVISPKRISIDTGAYLNGTLTAIRITSNNYDNQLLSVSFTN